MVAAYVGGKTIREVALQFDASTNTVMKAVTDRDAVRTSSEAHTKYKIEHGALAAESRSAFYWLGFLVADGNVSDRPGNSQPAVRLTLKGSDHGHVEKYRTFLGTDAPVRSNKQGQAVLVVYSSQLATSLLAAGKYAEEVPPYLASSVDFWRGVVDGDGSFGAYERARFRKYGYGPIAHFELVGSKSLLVSFRDFMVSCGLKHTEVRPHKSIHRVAWGSAQAIEAVRVLYRDAPDHIVLERKKLLAIVLLSGHSGHSDVTEKSLLRKG